MRLLNRKPEFPSTYVIIFAVTLIAAAVTWFVPGGEYVTGADGVTFVRRQSVPQTWQIMTSLYEGFTAQAGIIVFLLIIGGAFWIVNSAKAVDAGIHSFLAFTSRLERFRVLRAVGVNNIVLVLIMLMFSVFGAVFGMSEETIAFTVLIVPLAVSMGYDSIVGVCMVYVAAHVGFAGAVLNPFTVGVAQSLSGLQMFSGFEYRLVCWAVLNIVLIVFVLDYARKVRKDPRRSIMYEADARWREKTADASSVPDVLRTRSSWIAFALSSAAAVLFSVFYADRCTISIGNGSYRATWLLPAVSLCYIILSFIALRRNVRYFILTMLLFTVLYLIIGALGYSWYIEEIAALFLALGILSGIAAGYNANRIAREFLDGAKDIFSAALVVGLAAGIIHILENGRVIDTILYSMASGLGESGKVGSLAAMYGIQTGINLFMPSATAKAALTMPIMAPFSDLIGLSRQATVLAFQFGDGFTNMITPVSGVLIAVLGIAGIPYAKWVRWIWKFILLLIVLGFLLLIPTVLLPLNGF